MPSKNAKKKANKVYLIMFVLVGCLCAFDTEFCSQFTTRRVSTCAVVDVCR